MRQALELALEVIQDYVEEYGPHDKDSGAQYAINAIKEALAQPEQWGASAVTHPEYIAEQKAKTQELRSMLAQPEQEPVGEAYLCDRCHTPFNDAWECPSCGHNMAVKEPVYTTPPQRKPLTDEQIKHLAIDVYSPHQEPLIVFARAIEAAHGIKE